MERFPSVSCGQPLTARWSRPECRCLRTRQPPLQANRNRQASKCQEDPLKTNSRFGFFLTALLSVSILACCIGCGSKLAGDDVAAMVDGRKIYRVDVEK